MLNTFVFAIVLSTRTCAWMKITNELSARMDIERFDALHANTMLSMLKWAFSCTSDAIIGCFGLHTSYLCCLLCDFCVCWPRCGGHELRRGQPFSLSLVSFVYFTKWGHAADTTRAICILIYLHWQYLAGWFDAVDPYAEAWQIES